jgi:hypothetical protein
VTVEELIAALEAEGWYIWHVGCWPTRGWHCQLWTNENHPAVTDKEGRRMGGYRGGFSVVGHGATMADAIASAACNILHLEDDETVDLDALLR